MEAKHALARDGCARAAERRSGFGTVRRTRPVWPHNDGESGGGTKEAVLCPKVLIIEDNVDMADTLREMLEHGGHEVVVAHSGSDGLIKACELRPEVILCDIGLPGMSGYEVSRTLRSHAAFRKTYLVALTGYAAPDDVLRAAEAGFDRHLAKPFSPDVVMQLVKSIRPAVRDGALRTGARVAWRIRTGARKAH